MTYGLMLQLADDFGRLPDYLPPDTAPRLDTMGRTGTKVDAPIPIRPEVSDLLTAIAYAALGWEARLRADFNMGPVYWTKPRPVAVPLSLSWSAGILRDPPAWEDPYGFPRPGLIPHDTAAWIEGSCIALTDQVGRVIRERIVVARTTCARCEMPTLFTHPVTRETRCVRCGVQAA